MTSQSNSVKNKQNLLIIIKKWRYNEFLQNLTPADFILGESKKILKQRQIIKMNTKIKKTHTFLRC